MLGEKRLRQGVIWTQNRDIAKCVGRSTGNTGEWSAMNRQQTDANSAFLGLFCKIRIK
jgi:hypothetical protein